LALIKVTSLESFKKMLVFISPSTHVAIVDREKNEITLTPMVTSRHRHYIKYQYEDENEFEEIKNYLMKRGYVIVYGGVDFKE